MNTASSLRSACGFLRYLELDGMDELYDLEADPYEIENRIQQPSAAGALAEMKREMERLLKETNAGSNANRALAPLREILAVIRS